MTSLLFRGVAEKKYHFSLPVNHALTFLVAAGPPGAAPAPIRPIEFDGRYYTSRGTSARYRATPPLCQRLTMVFGAMLIDGRLDNFKRFGVNSRCVVG